MRHVIKGLIGAIILIILIWAGVWIYAEVRLKQIVEAQIGRINSSGLEHVSYDKLVTGRSPLVSSVTLLNPKLQITMGSSLPPATISAAQIGAHIDLLQPLLLHIDMPLRLTLGNPDEIGVLTFATATITQTLHPSIWQGNNFNTFSNGNAEFTGISLLASNGSLLVAQIDQLNIQETLNAQATNNQTALLLTDDMQNLRLSPLLTRILNLPFYGTITRFSSSLTLSGPINWQQIAQQNVNLQTADQRNHFMLQTLYNWAKAAGHAQGNLHLWLGPSQMQANFTLGFDQQTQPQGELSLHANHLEQFTAALTNSYPNLQGWVDQFESTFSPYLTTTAQDGQILVMPISYGEDGVFIGGQKVGAMPFINWDELLNPTLPTFAPGDGSGAAQP